MPKLDSLQIIFSEQSCSEDISSQLRELATFK